MVCFGFVDNKEGQPDGKELRKTPPHPAFSSLEIFEGGMPPIFWLISDYAAEAHLQGPSNADRNLANNENAFHLSSAPKWEILSH